MAAITETIRKTEISISGAVSKPKNTGRIRNEASINRFLIKNKGYEFVNGKLEKKEMPTAKHSGIATRTIGGLGVFSKQNKFGRVYGNMIFQIGANRRIPDVAFVSANKIPHTGEPLDIWNFAPDLAIEVISPSERHNKVEQKIREYFAAGVIQVWKIVPEFKTLTIYFSMTETKILTEDDVITCEEILPGFNLKLSDIFID
ncbi:MAG: Uma2 family endonuclease [Acidobacteriota bacterium]|nr:Uma2 family endonuclease [Acidobacteriota bacterium]